MEIPTEAESASPAPSIEPQEDFENERIEDALLARAHADTDMSTVTVKAMARLSIFFFINFLLR